MRISQSALFSKLVCKPLSWIFIQFKANGGNISAVQATLGHESRRTTEGYARALVTLDHSTLDRAAEFLELRVGSRPNSRTNSRTVGR